MTHGDVGSWWGAVRKAFLYPHLQPLCFSLHPFTPLPYAPSSLWLNSSHIS